MRGGEGAGAAPLAVQQALGARIFQKPWFWREVSGTFARETQRAVEPPCCGDRVDSRNGLVREQRAHP